MAVLCLFIYYLFTLLLTYFLIYSLPLRPLLFLSVFHSNSNSTALPFPSTSFCVFCEIASKFRLGKAQPRHMVGPIKKLQIEKLEKKRKKRKGYYLQLLLLFQTQSFLCSGRPQYFIHSSCTSKFQEKPTPKFFDHSIGMLVEALAFKFTCFALLQSAKLNFFLLFLCELETVHNMCTSSSSSSASCESNKDHMSALLIPKLPTIEHQILKPHQTHLCVALDETKCIAQIALPMVLTSLLLYSRSIISMLFLGRLGDLALAGGSLAIGFANISGYSVLSGLAMGMEPICGQAFGAKRFKLLGLAMQRTVLLLLVTSVFISVLWFNMKKILILCGQEEDIANEAQVFILYSLPDLLAQSLLHPLRIYLRSQSITLPLTYGASLSILLHIPINYLLVSVFKLGIKGIALSAVWTNFNLVVSLLIYIVISGIHRKTWNGVSSNCLKDWKPLMNLAIPSCISMCLEWWWYEIMILLCGLLLNPQATVASMGVLIQTTALIYTFPSSLSIGVSTRVGNELGAENPQRAKLAAIVGLCISFFLGFSALAFAISVRKVWASMFTGDTQIIALTSTVLPIIGLCELGNCPQTTVCGVLRGTARPKLGANINLGCFYVVGMPVAVWLGFFAGFDFKGLWLGLLAAQGSCMVTMLFVLARTNWEGQAQRAKELTSLDSSEEDDEDEEEKEEKDEEDVGLLV